MLKIMLNKMLIMWRYAGCTVKISSIKFCKQGMYFGGPQKNTDFTPSITLDKRNILEMNVSIVSFATFLIIANAT